MSYLNLVSLRPLLTALPTYLYILFFHISSTQAQVSVRGKVSNEAGKALGLAIVSLRQGASVVGNEITDSTGCFRFSDLKKGNYTFLIKLFSYRDTSIGIAISNDTLVDLQIRNSNLLPEAVVSAKKPIIRMELDRLRFNVGGTDLVFGNTVWDVMAKTPLVTATDNGTIQIAGTSGAVVYLNGRRKLLSGYALKAYLEALPSDNLEAIEVITTPSSKYDAEGGGGIVNIVTKKNKQEGFNGNASISDRETAVNSQSGSIFLNDRTGKWDIYSAVYVVNRNRKPTADQNFYFPASGGNAPASSDIHLITHNQMVGSGANLGIDYQINPNHVAGLLFDYSGNWNHNTRDAYTYDQYNPSDSLSYSNNTDKINSQTYSLNLNYDGKLDSTGKRLSVDFDALHYTSSYNSVSMSNALDDVTDQKLYVQDYFRSSSPQEVNNQSVKADFKWPLSKKLSVETGAKMSFSQINNNLVFENNEGSNVWVKDYTRSNLFQYNEDIAAGYVTLNHAINSVWTYQIGMRLENTIAKGWLDGEKAVDRNYIDAFPTAYLKFSPKAKQTYVLAVSSRITRPSYWDVNPFRTYTNDKTYWEGNPFLLPSRYYREELRRTLNIKKANITFMVAASQTLNEIYSLPYSDTGNVVVFKRVNYGNKYNNTGTVIYSSEFRPWWQFSGTIQAGYLRDIGNYRAEPIDNNSFLFTVSTNQTFTISKRGGLTGMFIASNQLPFTMVNTHIGDRFDTEIRFRKSSGPFNLTLSVTDLFKTNKDDYVVQASGLKAIEHFYNDTRSAALTLSYNFGKNTVKTNRDRDTQFQDVKGRIM